MLHPVETSEPTPSPAPGWTPERKALFLDRLSAHGNARAACRSVGLSAESAYKQRRRDPLFARGWAAAVVLGRDASIATLSERAVEGVEEEIYYRGELIGTRRRFDSRLLLAHLARLDQLADEEAAGADAARFDDLLACIAEDAGSEPLPDRTTHIEQATMAVEDHRRRELQAHDDAVNAASGVNGARDHAIRCRAEAIVKLNRDCAARQKQAGEQAAEAWDRRRAEAIAIVDAMCAMPKATIPRTARRAIGLSVGEPSDSVLAPRTEATANLLPCTLSTASTTALAHALALPSTGQAFSPQPRSPFSAPKSVARR